MTRDEAEARVLESEAAITEPENLEGFLDRLGLSRSEMEDVLADPLRHMKYSKPESVVRRTLRTVKHRTLDPILGRH
jgi:hypothetical protein